MKFLALISVLIFSGICMAKSTSNEFKLVITENGYEPSTLKVKAGTPVVLKITRKTNTTCAREVVIPSQKLKYELPLNKEVTIKIASLPKGEIKFGCAMNMMVSGVMNVQ